MINSLAWYYFTLKMICFTCIRCFIEAMISKYQENVYGINQAIDVIFKYNSFNSAKKKSFNSAKNKCATYRYGINTHQSADRCKNTDIAIDVFFLVQMKKDNKY